MTRPANLRQLSKARQLDKSRHSANARQIAKGSQTAKDRQHAKDSDGTQDPAWSDKERQGPPSPRKACQFLLKAPSYVKCS
jgi:hypothetical protein